MKIYIVDTGISAVMKSSRNKINGFTLYITPSGVVRKDIYDDTEGHGTAVTRLIDRKVCGCEITMVKIDPAVEKTVVFNTWLIHALEYIEANEHPDIINMSCGITQCPDVHRLKKVCDKLHDRGVVIVAAYSNEGTMTYPALFASVIGIDTSRQYCKPERYEYIDETINIRSAFVTWKLPDPSGKGIKDYEGNSFAAPLFTAKVANILLKGVSPSDVRLYLKEDAVYVHNESIPPQFHEDKQLYIRKALVFPFNKEVHALARNEDMIHFKIMHYCDLKASGKVGAVVGEMVGCDTKDLIIDFDKVEWNNDFDTVILSHLQTLSVLTSRDLFEEVVGKCLEYRKNLYMFDEEVFVSEERYNAKRKQFEAIGRWLMRPSKQILIHPEWGGKLYDITAPVVCVAGTSSKQGKFTIQIALRKALIQAGYRVGSFGSEPVSKLLGFEGMYTMGYGAYMPYAGWKNIIACNYTLHEMDNQNPEIIITGLQENVVPYRGGALNGYPIKQQEFLMACAPDAYIVCVNPDDDLAYIKRAILYMEGLFDSKVIMLCVNDITKPLTQKEAYTLKVKLMAAFKMPVCCVTDKQMADITATTCIKYFGKNTGR